MMMRGEGQFPAKNKVFCGRPAAVPAALPLQVDFITKFGYYSAFFLRNPPKESWYHMISMRLMRFGAKSKPSYRIVVIDSNRPRESKAKEFIGFYNPLKDPAEVKIDLAKANAWLKKGAQPSRTVHSLLQKVSKPEKLSP